jgi:hypothetical protein
MKQIPLTKFRHDPLIVSSCKNDMPALSEDKKFADLWIVFKASFFILGRYFQVSISYGIFSIIKQFWLFDRAQPLMGEYP